MVARALRSYWPLNNRCSHNHVTLCRHRALPCDVCCALHTHSVKLFRMAIDQTESSLRQPSKEHRNHKRKSNAKVCEYGWLAGCGFVCAFFFLSRCPSSYKLFHSEQESSLYTQACLARQWFWLSFGWNVSMSRECVVIVFVNISSRKTNKLMKWNEMKWNSCGCEHDDETIQISTTTTVAVHKEHTNCVQTTMWMFTLVLVSVSMNWKPTKKRMKKNHCHDSLVRILAVELCGTTGRLTRYDIRLSVKL